MTDGDDKPVDEKKEEKKEEKKIKHIDKKDKKKLSTFEEDTGSFDGKCSECNEPINGSAIICECGKIFHQYCHDVHVLSKHCPNVKSVDVTHAKDAYTWNESKDIIS